MNLTLQPVWEGLAENKWSDAQLSALDQELAGLDFLRDYKLAMRGEMILGQIGTIEFLRRYPEQIPNLFAYEDEFWSSFRPVVLCRLLPRGWFYQNQVQCARIMVEHWLPLVDLERRVVDREFVVRAERATGQVISRKTPYNFLARMFLPALGPASIRFANAQNSVDLVRLAIALERFRLAHGKYPESLEQLVPQFIAKLPHDVATGEPLKYQRTSDGCFILYSVGWNGIDDGGQVALTKTGEIDWNSGDWVWQYPRK